MKITFSSIFFNLFFLITTVISLLHATSATVYDSSGNKLLRNIPYYILPLVRGSGGGLTVSQTTQNACPLNVTQESFEIKQGIPFLFNPIVLDEDFIRSSYPISIELGVTNPCSGSKLWKVTVAAPTKKNDDDEDKDKDKDNVSSVEIVTTGGEFNKPDSCFQLVEDVMMPGLQSYQIQNCPFKCGSSGTGLTCYNVGIIKDADGNGYLGRTDAIFPVVFTSSYGTFSQSAETNAFSLLSTKVSSSSSLSGHEVA